MKIRTVYVLTAGYYSDYRIVECYASRKTANLREAQLRSRRSFDSAGLQIQEYDLLVEPPKPETAS